ncbi:MAG: hypothetical protein AAB490_02820 [Patescibacteria group bacterium]
MTQTITCDNARYLLREAEKGEFDEELLDQALKHTQECVSCRAPFEELARVGEMPCIVIPDPDGRLSKR